MNMKNTKNLKSTTLVAVGFALAFSAAAPAATTINDNLVNTVSVVDSCYVIATGIDFGVVPSPMVTDVPGLLVNAADTGTISVTLVGQTVNVLTVSTPGVNVVCSATPSSITVTLGGGTPTNLRTIPLTGTTAGLTGQMTGPAGAKINYEMGFLGVQSPALLNGVVATYVGVFAWNPAQTKIPKQAITGTAGTYSDVATVAVTY